MTARPYDLAIVGGRVAVPGVDTPIEMDVGVRDGRVVALAASSAPQAGEVVDARGLWVLPGLIDMHVHFRDPGLPHKDTFLDGTTAAAFGGVTTVCDMPNTIPAVTSERAFTDKLAAVASQAMIDFGLFAGGRDPGEVAAMARRGAIGLKIYLMQPEKESPIYPRALFTEDSGALWDALRLARDESLLVSVHMDDSPVRARHIDALRQAGRRRPRDFWEGRQCVASLLAIERTLTIARALGMPVHIAHINHGPVEAFDLVRQARRRGARVTIEAVPPTLDLEDLDRLGPLALSWAMSAEEQAAFWRAVADGTIDAIATDHAPHSLEEKHRGVDDIWEAPTGFPAVETTLPLLLTDVAAGRLSLRRMLELCCSRPAEILSLSRKGRIAIGHDADLVLVDPAARWRIEAPRLHYRVGWTPHEGKEVLGRVVGTFVRGQPVVRDTALVGLPGTGRLVRPPASPTEVQGHSAASL